MENFRKRFPQDELLPALSVTLLLHMSASVSGRHSLPPGRETKMLFPDADAVICEVDGVRFSVEKGFCLMISAGASATAQVPEGGGFSAIGMSGTELPILLRSIPAEPLIPVSNPLLLSELFAQAAGASGTKTAAAADRTGCAYRILSLLMVENEQPTQKDYGKRAIEYMQQNYMRAITVEDVARNIGISRSWLYRCVMDFIEQSPTQYLQELRINRSRSLLTHTELSVQEVADAVGFEDPLYFSRVFRNYMGISPGQFRKQRQ